MANNYFVTDDRIIDGLPLEEDVYHRTICSTGKTVAAKTVTLKNFTLSIGAFVIVKFSAGNSATVPTLNVNDTGAKPITYRGVNVGSAAIGTGSSHLLVYDGKNWEIVGDLDTRYSNATQSAAGLMSAADKEKLDGIEDNANKVDPATASPENVSSSAAVGTSAKYAREDHVHKLPTASSSTLGGVKTGFTKAEGSTYIRFPVSVSSDRMYVEIPFGDKSNYGIMKTYSPDNARTYTVDATQVYPSMQSNIVLRCKLTTYLGYPVNATLDLRLATVESIPSKPLLEIPNQDNDFFIVCADTTEDEEVKESNRKIWELFFSKCSYYGSGQYWNTFIVPIHGTNSYAKLSYTCEYNAENAISIKLSIYSYATDTLTFKPSTSSNIVILSTNI